MFASILYTGSGMFVVGICAGCFIFMEIAVNKLFDNDRYYAAHGWPKLAAFWVAAALTWLFCRYLGDEDDDLKIGERTLLRHGENTMLLVPIRYWPILFFVLGIVFSFIHDK
ncbi:MAG TPA: hypothetical protein VHX65_06860 [Pirellulales bacterium]|jgi:hypothetical protein|nr:hypothetical protein [Pirellulales bacterium]